MITSNDAAAIELIGLKKRFSKAGMVVDGLTLTVEKGQVFGLLGPNGAGKTTVLRMLLGLVHPTAGEARLFGKRVRTSDPVLRRVGALVERPAFVPHLSGLANLEFFWRAGGQRMSESHIDEALEIAGLGKAIRRKVRTYSTGMRQRLGIAQALLGATDLLVLDEPTVGLDPEEMRETRKLVRDVAQRGATVFLSSHILAEVEQVCTHAAIVDKGHLVAVGTVSQLVGASVSVYLEVDDVDKAVIVLEGIPGVGRVVREQPGLSLSLDGVERKALVAALVQAGVGVETITSRHRLEDAFLQMLGTEGE
ncbi:MAG: ABC transporter ATP-binding protein [Dehalococcoidia bacterium]|jgi:ABC-2 type transport system ATP-binding protein